MEGVVTCFEDDSPLPDLTKMYLPGNPLESLPKDRQREMIASLKALSRYLKSCGRTLAKPKEVSPGYMRRLLGKRSSAIFRHLDTLRAIVDRHELTIQKRWTKKTNKQRLKIMLSAWPGLPASHRPDFLAHRMKAGPESRDAFIWPYLNQEDLIRPRALLLLLNYRSRNHPSRFAVADLETASLGRMLGTITPVFLPTHLVTLNGISDRKKDQDYGKLLLHGGLPDAPDWDKILTQFDPSEALVVLEAQERLMRFLVECCTLILHDIPVDLLTSHSYPIQPEPPSVSQRLITGHASLSIMAQETPYCLPPSLPDMSRLAALLSAATVSAQDHLWSLREDPGFFLHFMLELKEHRTEMILDANGKKHPVLHPQHMELFWETVIIDIVLFPYMKLNNLSKLAQVAQSLHDMQLGSSSPRISNRKPSEDYFYTLIRFRAYLTYAAQTPLRMLQMFVAGSIPFRSLHVRESIKASQAPIRAETRTSMLGSIEAQLLFLLKTLADNGDTLGLLRMPLVVDELQRLIEKEPRARDMITGFIGGIIGHLAIICECLKQVDICHTWAESYDSVMEEHNEAAYDEWNKAAAIWEDMVDVMHKSGPEWKRIVQLGIPKKGKFDYPLWKCETEDNTKLLRQSEANLDAFWSALDRFMNKEVGGLAGTAVKDFLTQPRLLQRTPEWIDPGESIETSSDFNSQTSLMPLSELYSQLELRTSQTLCNNSNKTLSSKTKTKTRGSPSTLSVDLNPDVKTERPESRLKFTVDALALKVFRTLFFTPLLNNTPGEVLWKDFIHAMTSVGFGSEKLYGSIWHFTPDNLDVERSIQFHEPHSPAKANKIPFHSARRHGRRLCRAYGWHGDMFVLREKTVSAPSATTPEP
ncbi:hypothetical protein LTR84_012904 [Exophiala bonariae]|uniref:Uncharacterized protein n=1 Tax=Exophiala bonariae TaxID=1690606 RepID=A0AAV9NGW4_9EURO|nr:hypothetical protein LTR84_012904 [Exophiala bonariae]